MSDLVKYLRVKIEMKDRTINLSSNSINENSYIRIEHNKNCVQILVYEDNLIIESYTIPYNNLIIIKGEY